MTRAQTGRTWTLAAVGDVMLERAPTANPIHDLLHGADVAFANLEVPLSDRGHPADKLIVFRSLPSLAPALREMGLDIVSFANNHALDYGMAAFLQTIEVVEAAGVRIIGAGADLSAAMRSVVTEHRGMRVAWLGFASTLPTGWAATPDRPGVAPLRVRVRIEADTSVIEEQPGTSPYVSTEVIAEDVAHAAAAIGRARQDADAVVVSVHWGVPPGWAAPFQGTLADYQRPLAHALIDAGADAILGHHPHTLHGVEVYRGRPILYSLGNFLFHAMTEGRAFALGRPAPPYRLEATRVPELEESAVFVLEFDAWRCTRITIHPTVADAAGEQRPADASRASRILERMQVLCGALGTTLMPARGVGTIDVA